MWKVRSYGVFAVMRISFELALAAACCALAPGGRGVSPWMHVMVGEVRANAVRESSKD